LAIGTGPQQRLSWSCALPLDYPMPSVEHLALLNKDLISYNTSRDNNPKILPDLGGVDLHKADLTKANLRNAALSKADFSSADLTEANLSWADLGEANLSGANLRRADLYEADLRGAKLIGAELSAQDRWRAKKDAPFTPIGNPNGLWTGLAPGPLARPIGRLALGPLYSEWGSSRCLDRRLEPFLSRLAHGTASVRLGLPIEVKGAFFLARRRS